jgi:hypothetical protein
VSRLRSRIVVAVFPAVLIAALPAVADGPSNGEVHCVVEVIDQVASGELVLSTPSCYPTFAEAMMAASGGMLTTEAMSGEELFADQTTGVVLSSFTLGVHFDGYNGAGSSISVVGSSFQTFRHQQPGVVRCTQLL